MPEAPQLQLPKITMPDIPPELIEKLGLVALIVICGIIAFIVLDHLYQRKKDEEYAKEYKKKTVEVSIPLFMFALLGVFYNETQEDDKLEALKKAFPNGVYPYMESMKQTFAGITNDHNTMNQTLDNNSAKLEQLDAKFKKLKIPSVEPYALKNDVKEVLDKQYATLGAMTDNLEILTRRTSRLEANQRVKSVKRKATEIIEIPDVE